KVREDAADPPAGLPVLLEGERALHDAAEPAGDGLDPGAGVELPAVVLGQGRLVVEGVALADAAVHEELDDAPHLGPVVQPAVEFRASGGLTPPGGRLPREQAAPAEQVRQGDATQAPAQAPQQV